MKISPAEFDGQTNTSIPSKTSCKSWQSGCSQTRSVYGLMTTYRHISVPNKKRWNVGVGYLERETFDAFLKPPATQRRIIREVILAFAKAHDTVDAADT
jgi:hypothetical protein